MDAQNKKHTVAFSLTGIIVTMGIVFGDIGTSPLYVFKALNLFDGFRSNPDMIKGGVSAIFWTLTMQTTIKYVLLTLRADNNGEGGIFALYALLRKLPRKRWLYIIAIIGGSTLLADGVITCAITVTSSIEGLEILNPDINVVPIVLIIISALFALQRVGTNSIGWAFGPVMSLWFLFLGIIGTVQIIQYPLIIESLNPFYAYNLLANYPGTFILLGAIFLCTTGAEALYADMGHCGIKNIRVSWILVKIMLVLCYLGQGAYLIQHGATLSTSLNPFFEIVPKWFIIPSVLLATMAAVIASQALISGAFTLVNEAISLNFFPKLRIRYTSNIRGQMYIPKVNLFLWLGCCFVVFFFRESMKMEAAYGLAITITMLMTTILMIVYLHYKQKLAWPLVALFALVFLSIEISFLISNLHKFMHGGWFTLLLGSVFLVAMIAWYNGERIRKRFVKFLNIENYVPEILDISQDESIPKTATNLVFMSKTGKVSLLDDKNIFSIINQYPKRADTYWIIHIEDENQPYTCDYEVIPIEKNRIYRINMRLGFRIERKINQFFVQILSDLAKDNEIDNLSHYDSLRKYNELADYKFIIIQRLRNPELKLSLIRGAVLTIHDLLERIGLPLLTSYGLHSGNAVIEHVPMSLDTKYPRMIERKDA